MTAPGVSQPVPRSVISSYHEREETSYEHEAWRHGTGLPRGDDAKGRSASTTGSATPGRCCSRTRRTSRRSARPSSATWRRSSPEFEKRNVKIIGLSVDPMDKHDGWARRTSRRRRAHARTTRSSPTPTSTSRSCTACSAPTSPATRATAPPADNQTVRNVFVIGPDKKVKLDPRLPDDDRPQLRRGAARDRLAAAHGQAQGRRRR